MELKQKNTMKGCMKGQKTTILWQQRLFIIFKSKILILFIVEKVGTWTEWKSRDIPSGTGDWEDVAHIPIVSSARTAKESCLS